MTQGFLSHLVTYSALSEDGWFLCSVQLSDAFLFNMQIAELGLYTWWLPSQHLAVSFDKWLCMCNYPFSRSDNLVTLKHFTWSCFPDNFFFFGICSYFIFRVVRNIALCVGCLYSFSVLFHLRKASTCKFSIAVCFWVLTGSENIILKVKIWQQRALKKCSVNAACKSCVFLIQEALVCGVMVKLIKLGTGKWIVHFYLGWWLGFRNPFSFEMMSLTPLFKLMVDLL